MKDLATWSLFFFGGAGRRPGGKEGRSHMCMDKYHFLWSQINDKHICIKTFTYIIKFLLRLWTLLCILQVKLLVFYLKQEGIFLY